MARLFLRSTMLAAALWASQAAAETLTSTTYIPPGETFLLGGGQPGGFRVSGRNAGSEVVVVSAKPEIGPVRLLATADPGETFEAFLDEGEMAQFRNQGDGRAVLRLRITGATSGLGMRYGPNAP